MGELAQRVGVATHVLRHWEDAGLLAPGRDSSGYRRYDRDDLVRVLVIQRNKAAGMGLPQIRVLLDADAPDRHRILDERLAAIDATITELQHSRAMVEHAMRCQAHDVATCPRFVAEVEDLLARG